MRRATVGQQSQLEVAGKAAGTSGSMADHTPSIPAGQKTPEQGPVDEVDRLLTVNQNLASRQALTRPLTGNQNLASR